MKFGKFLIFIGLLFIGAYFYMQYVGDIPIIDKVFESVGVKVSDPEVVGEPIKVEKINAIEYNSVGGQAYEVHKEVIGDTVSKDFFVNVKLGNEPYRLSFKYPENLDLLSGDDNSITIGNDNTNITINYTYDKYEELVEWYAISPDFYNYYVKSFSITNEISNVYVFNISEGDDELFINKASILIYDKNGEGNGIQINIRTKNSIIPDSLLINFYNSFVFEKTNHDFELCKLEDNIYKCSFNLNNYVNSSKKKISFEFDSNLYEIENFSDENNFLSSSLSLKNKDYNYKNYVYISFDIVYNSSSLIKTEAERYNYEEEVIGGRKYLIKRYSSNKVNMFYEAEPNLFVRISISSTDGLFDQAFNTFTNFKVN